MTFSPDFDDEAQGQILGGQQRLLHDKFDRRRQREFAIGIALQANQHAGTSFDCDKVVKDAGAILAFLNAGDVA